MELYCPFAQWWPGHMDKVNGFANPVDGDVCHSVEGSAYNAWLIVIQPPSPKARNVSWQFTITKTGEIWQHYPINAQCWHSGTAFGNNALEGVEHEGKAGEPLTEAQRNASVRLARWLAEQGVFAISREWWGGLWEHGEVQAYAGFTYPTSCPSNRIPWAYYTPGPWQDALPPPPPPEEELPAELFPMDFNASLAALENMNNDFGDVGSDQNGNAMLGVTSIPGLTIPAGKKAVVVIIDDWDID